MNCKPGDLAIIVKSMVPANIGKIVMVLKFYKTDDRFGPLWFVDGENISEAVGLRDLDYRVRRDSARPLYGPDDWMKPVSGLPVDDEVTEDLKEPA